MKHITKITVISLIASSAILTSFAASANSDVEEKTTETTSQQVSNKNTADENNKIAETTKAKVIIESENTAKAVNDQKGPTTESKEEDEFSVCFGECENHESRNCDEDDDKCEKIHRLIHNRRDGFYVDVSAISSFGDDYTLSANEDTESEFDESILGSTINNALYSFS